MLDESNSLKIKDLFETEAMLEGRTEIENVNKLNTGLVWSCTGLNFVSQDPELDNIAYNTTNGSVTSEADNLQLAGNVSGIPHGATITGVIMYGNAGAIAGITWTLYRKSLVTGDASAMASAAVGTEDITITNALIDNINYSYFFAVGADEFDNTDSIFGARITYTI